MSDYFDTPVIVFACANKGDLGERARSLLAGAPDPVTTPHTLAECFNALTYRLGLPPRVANKLIAKNMERFSFVPLVEADYRDAIGKVVALGMTGDKIYDALHVGAAVKAAAAIIHTSNKRDFAPFGCAIPISKIGPS